LKTCLFSGFFLNSFWAYTKTRLSEPGIPLKKLPAFPLSAACSGIAVVLLSHLFSASGYCPKGMWDGKSCYCMPAPPTVFILNNSFYMKPDSCLRCSEGTYDGKWCYFMEKPDHGFIYNNGFYTSPVNNKCLCGSFDGKNCFIRWAPEGTFAKEKNGKWYFTPVPSCASGEYDGTNCLVMKASEGTKAFVENGSLYTTPAHFSNPHDDPGEWVSVFGDEFSGKVIDTANNWRRMFSWGNQCDWHAYRTEDTSNVKVKDGCLEIIQKKGAVRGDCWSGSTTFHDSAFKYSTAMLLSKKTWQYGFFEVRCKIPKSKGTGANFWLMDVDSSGENYKEIDVFEFDGAMPGKVTMNSHWREGSCSCKEKSSDYHEFLGPDFSLDFHVFAVDWTPVHLIYYVDNEIVYVSNNNPSHYSNMRIIIDVNVWSPDSSTLPNSYYVDYVRVYKKKP
jgi:beta-glucanase (GH16 family)